MKKKYIITYDLNKPGQDYDSLIEAIKSYDNAYALKSAWFVKTSRPSVEIYNHLASFIDKSDGIFIAEITSNWYCYLDKTVIDWLNKD
jgi:hypothetical protein